jgi:PhzF family phenazine biosynthesis protein
MKPYHGTITIQERRAMKYPIYQVDAFTGHLFAGNPAAVVFCESGLTPEIMQSIALENNLSDTAFVVPNGKDYQIRWFTPSVDVDLCGHATLASAHVLFNHLGYSTDTISFSSKSGPLYVRKEGEILYLNFPADSIQAVGSSQLLIDGLGEIPIEIYKGRDDYLAVFDNEDTISSLNPDMTLLSKVPARGVIITAPGNNVDFVSRFFAPQAGIPEDPVTGSAHTTLVPYWSNRLGKQHLQARQVSRRGGELICRDLGSRVEIGGRAVTYLIGEISM